jgi:hypothetical protein
MMDMDRVNALTEEYTRRPPDEKAAVRLMHLAFESSPTTTRPGFDEERLLALLRAGVIDPHSMVYTPEGAYHVADRIRRFATPALYAAMHALWLPRLALRMRTDPTGILEPIAVAEAHHVDLTGTFMERRGPDGDDDRPMTLWDLAVEIYGLDSRPNPFRDRLWRSLRLISPERAYAVLGGARREASRLSRLPSDLLRHQIVEPLVRRPPPLLYPRT